MNTGSHRLSLGSLVWVAVMVASTVSACEVRAPGPPPSRVYRSAPPPRPVYASPPPQPVYASPPPQPVYAPPPPQPMYASPPPQPVYASPPPQPMYAPPPPQPAYAPPPPPPNAACIDPGQRDLSERFDQATPIDPTSTTVGCMFRNDDDMFVTTVPPGAAGSVIHFSVRGQTRLSPTIHVFDANRKSLFRASGPSSTELKGWVHVAGGTPVFLKVAQIHSETEPYFLTLKTDPLPEPGEPNNEMTRATPLREGVAVSGYVSTAANDPTSTDDWYQIDARHDGPLKLDLDMSQGISPTISIFDSNRRKIERRSGGNSERIQASAMVRRGTYFILVNTIHTVPSAGKGEMADWLIRPYTLTVVR